MRVLNLVTNEEAHFYRQQVERLADRGVASATLPVPGNPGYGNSRSVLAYLQYVAPVLRASRGDFDLVHANFGLTAPHALVQRSLPVVLTLWGTDLMGEYGWVSRLCARRADAVVVMSEGMAAELDCPCYVIPHGVDLEKFAPAPQGPALADVGWGSDARHLLFPYNTVRDVKDYPRAERVAAAVDERSDERVVLHSITDVPHDRVSVYMNAADCLLITSKREGSPNAVKEALACNLPVVSTDVGDVAERLAGVEPSAVAASDVGLADGVLDVLRSGERSNGREAAREVSGDRTSERLRGVYRDVVENA